jgi:hypothetical protein
MKGIHIHIHHEYGLTEYAQRVIVRATQDLRAATSRLDEAVARNRDPHTRSTHHPQIGDSMTDQSSAVLLESLRLSVASTVDVMASAKTLIDGIAGRIQAAVDAAVAKGATAEQLAPINEEIAALTGGSSDLASSVANYTEPDAPATT